MAAGVEASSIAMAGTWSAPADDHRRGEQRLSLPLAECAPPRGARFGAIAGAL